MIALDLLQANAYILLLNKKNISVILSRDW